MDRSNEEVVSGGAAAVRRFSLSWAECRAPLLRAALLLWLPALLPFVSGPLTECAHCVRLYLSLLPVLPGFLAAAWCRDEPWFYAVGLVGTLALLALVALLVALAGRRWLFVAVPVALLSGAQALGLAHMLRM